MKKEDRTPTRDKSRFKKVPITAEDMLSDFDERANLNNDLGQDETVDNLLRINDNNETSQTRRAPVNNEEKGHF